VPRIAKRINAQSPHAETNARSDSFTSEYLLVPLFFRTLVFEGFDLNCNKVNGLIIPNENIVKKNGKINPIGIGFLNLLLSYQPYLWSPQISCWISTEKCFDANFLTKMFVKIIMNAIKIMYGEKFDGNAIMNANENMAMIIQMISLFVGMV